MKSAAAGKKWGGMREMLNPTSALAGTLFSLYLPT